MKSPILFLLILFSSLNSFAVTKTYTGASGSDWSVAANWSPTGIPTSADYAIIPVGITVAVAGNQTGTPVGFIEIRGVLDLTNNGKLTVDDGVYIVSPGGPIGNGNSDQLRVNSTTYSGNDITALPDGQTGSTGSFPVKLNSFESSVMEGKVILLWNTSNELDFNKFEVERSRDARVFERIGNVQGKELEVYSFNDDFPIKGENYYRLKMVDLDGSYEYSKIIVANYTGKEDFKVFPNPVLNGVIKVNGLEENETIDLFEINGRKIDYRLIEGGIEINSSRVNSGEFIFIKTTLGNSAKLVIE
ncbi:hypothetical protein [Arcticibacterium luteifluviistationis]|uniref:Secretion system C-terminal sorting domain-containing protein n=1 Tax=Arcticibacterium luteifluviistationis TaxID=1784714 RepID=A0A2Z4GII8_9BACT|nr:hypothetical protein [Arcticibacterium luteifluviistationis]AWW00674.1 hypothetical protein DJ013_21795 [Arcticibacterium luteifluviistationis]